MVADRDRQQFYSACRCYRERKLVTPIKGVTWEGWFEKKWGEDLISFFRRAKAENLVERIAQHEEEMGFPPMARIKAEETRELMQKHANRKRAGVKAAKSRSHSRGRRQSTTSKSRTAKSQGSISSPLEPKRSVKKPSRAALELSDSDPST